MTEIASGNQYLADLTHSNIEHLVVDLFEKIEADKHRVSSSIQTLDDDLAFLRSTQQEHLKRFPDSVRTIYTQEVLNCILRNDRAQALAIIDRRIASGDWGGFGFGKNTFFNAARDWLSSR